MAPQTPPRRLLLGISLKMYFTPHQTATYITSLLPLLPLLSTLPIDIFLLPTFLSLPPSLTLLPPPSPLHLGAQNCFWEDAGPFTGEVSPSALAALGAWMVELGHAERRALLGETDDMVAKKAAAVERNGMRALVCIGERERGTVEQAVEECRGQMEPVLRAMEGSGEVIWAYEPVWAIGKKESAAGEWVRGVVAGIRRVMGEREWEGRMYRVIYGGSAQVGTWGTLKEAVDGLFLGRFAHDVGNLERIAREVGGMEV